jgi:hypothetical protein
MLLYEGDGKQSWPRNAFLKSKSCYYSFPFPLHGNPLDRGNGTVLGISILELFNAWFGKGVCGLFFSFFFFVLYNSCNIIGKAWSDIIHHTSFLVKGMNYELKDYMHSYLGGLEEWRSEKRIGEGIECLMCSVCASCFCCNFMYKVKEPHLRSSLLVSEFLLETKKRWTNSWVAGQVLDCITLAAHSKLHIRRLSWLNEGGSPFPLHFLPLNFWYDLNHF